MLVCFLYADIIYKSLSSNNIVELQDIVNIPYYIFYIINRSPSRGITYVEGEVIVLFYAAIRS